MIPRRKKRKKKPPQWRPGPHSVPKIKEWVQDWYARRGEYPIVTSGRIPGTLGETWVAVDAALRVGSRGLSGKSSLADFLFRHFGKRNAQNPPLLTASQIRDWIREWHELTGRYPQYDDGEIPNSGGEIWSSVSNALNNGKRGLPQSGTLADFIERYFGQRNRRHLPKMSESQIHTWIKNWHSRWGKFPSLNSGPIPNSGGETWLKVNRDLLDGLRGLPGKSSLAQFLTRHYRHRNIQRLPALGVSQVRSWIVRWHKRTGAFPMKKDGAIPGSGGETWSAIETALLQGKRGLPQAGSLADFLVREFSTRNKKRLPHLDESKVKDWIQTWHARTGRYPRSKDGVIPKSGGETWSAINNALRRGSRGLPKHGSLSILLETAFGQPHPKKLPKLTLVQIRNWATAYLARERKWPTANSELIPEADEWTWAKVNQCLRKGTRGLSGGQSLRRLRPKNSGIGSTDH